MTFTTEHKNEIRELVKNGVRIAGSQNKFAMQHKEKFSAPMVYNLIKGNWDGTIGHGMWQKFAAAVGYQANNWVRVRTRTYNHVSNLLADAQQYHEVFAYIVAKGSGKTDATKAYARTYPNVYHMPCEAHWHKKDFLGRLYQLMGEDPAGLNTAELMDAIELSATKTSNPLIILDEIDKLRDDLLYFFISLYNRLEGKCGMFLCATPHLKMRIEKGMKKNKRGYSEFFSRTGGKFIEGGLPTGAEIKEICEKNGVTDPNEIDRIIEDSGGDLRRVRRLVESLKRKQGSTNRQTALIGMDSIEDATPKRSRMDGI